MPRRNGLLAGRFLCGCLSWALSLLPLCVAAAPAPMPERAVLDAAFDDAYARYRLPGLAVGIVVDGEVAYVRTAGELAAGGGQAIDAASVFKVASNSKSMTTALLARLVAQGRLQWDDPVVKHLPAFRMHDDWVTREMQVRDLLIHNSGLGPGAGDLMLWPEPNLFTREQVIHGLRHLKPRYSFRSRYAYDNSLYIVAGEVAAAAGGAPYDRLLRREVFEPLGMARCQAGEWRRDAVGNVAQPHMRSGESNVVIRADDEVVPDVPMMAAGGIRCSLDDMLAWMRAWLQPEGDIVGRDGAPWLAQAQREALWTAHMPMPLSRRMRDWDGSHFSAYGYGWRLTDMDGTAKVSHTGTLAGMYSAVVLLPERRVGIVFLSNGEADEARTVLTQVLAKRFTVGAEESARQTVGYYAGLLAEARAAADTGASSPKGASGVGQRSVASVAALRAVLGRYRDPWFGDVDLCPAPDGEGVWFRSLRSPKLTGTVQRVGRRWLVDWHEADVDVDAWLDVVPAAQAGQPPRLRMAKTDPEADFSYDFEDLDLARTGACGAGGPD